MRGMAVGASNNLLRTRVNELNAWYMHGVAMCELDM